MKFEPQMKYLNDKDGLVPVGEDAIEPSDYVFESTPISTTDT